MQIYRLIRHRLTWLVSSFFLVVVGFVSLFFNFQLSITVRLREFMKIEPKRSEENKI